MRSIAAKLSTFLSEQVWSVLPALELLPLWRDQSRGSNSDTGKMDQILSTFRFTFCASYFPLIQMDGIYVSGGHNTHENLVDM